VRVFIADSARRLNVPFELVMSSKAHLHEGNYD
jgi:hypothetical protein